MPDVIIVGAGLAGLSCALHLQQRGISFEIIEASDAVGGRVRTDVADGFRFDRGFQVMLTAYPELRKVLNYRELHLCDFEPGAMVRYKGEWHHLVDPRRVPRGIPRSLFSPIATMRDKWNTVALTLRLIRKPLDAIHQAPEITTAEALRLAGISPSMIERFMRPFLAGIYLEEELTTSSRKFEFVFKMFAEGYASLPANGMQAIPDQLASQLPRESIRLNCRIAKVEPGTVRAISGDEFRGRAVVIATDITACSQLLPQVPQRPTWATTCFYFAAPFAPIEKPILMLNADNDGPVNNLTVMSNVASTYAPAGTALISATVLGTHTENEPELVTAVERQLRQWFGDQTRTWRLLRTYNIRHALPSQSPEHGGMSVQESRLADGLYVAGDYLDSGSLNGAVASGRRAAEAVAADLAGVTGAEEKAS
jgi:phytoene dehydrogenase-like protein